MFAITLLIAVAIPVTIAISVAISAIIVRPIPITIAISSSFPVVISSISAAQGQLLYHSTAPNQNTLTTLQYTV